MKMDAQEIQLRDNRKWEKVTLTNDNGMTVSFLNYGGISTEILVPDKNGKCGFSL